MKKQFILNIKIGEKEIESLSKVIPNAIHSVFEKNLFDFENEKEADFITIRHFDSPKYGIDLVVKAAEENPDHEFHLYGTGIYFKYYSCPNNLKVIEATFTHEELLQVLKKYKASLMPTRLDSQGVMACEMASFGMPLVTSNISLCREMFEGFGNVELIENDSFIFEAEKLIKCIKKENFIKNRKFYAENTVQKELEYFNELVSKL